MTSHARGLSSRDQSERTVVVLTAQSEKIAYTAADEAKLSRPSRAESTTTAQTE